MKPGGVVRAASPGVRRAETARFPAAAFYNANAGVSGLWINVCRQGDGAGFLG